MDDVDEDGKDAAVDDDDDVNDVDEADDEHDVDDEDDDRHSVCREVSMCPESCALHYLQTETDRICYKHSGKYMHDCQHIQNHVPSTICKHKQTRYVINTLASIWMTVNISRIMCPPLSANINR